MILKKYYKSIGFTSMLLMLFVCIVFVVSPKPNIKNPYDYEGFDVIYEEEDVYFTRLLKNKQVFYYLNTGNKIIDVGGTLYENTDNVISFDVEENQDYLLQIMNEEDQKKVRFYYATDVDDLAFVVFESIISPWIFLVGFGLVVVLLPLTILINRWLEKEKEKNVSTKGLWDIYKKASLSRKLLYGLLVVVFVVIPMALLIVLAFHYFRILMYHIKGYQNKLISLSFLLISVVVGVTAFFGTYVLINPSSLKKPVINMPEEIYTSTSQSMYQKLVERSALYKNDPLIFIEEDNITMMMFETYKQMYSLDQGKVMFEYTLLYEVKSNNEMTIFIYDQHDQMISMKKHPLDQSEQSAMIIDEDVTNIKIEIRNSDDILMMSVYNHEITHNYLEVPVLYKGTQYSMHMVLEYVYFLVSIHLGTLCLCLVSVLFGKKMLQVDQIYDVFKLEIW